MSKEATAKWRQKRKDDPAYRAACAAAQVKRRAKRTPEQAEAERAAHRVWSNQHYHANAGKIALDRVAKRYGLPRAEVELLAGKDTCEACGDPARIGTGHLGGVVDHCHATLRVRGLLCQGCNKAIGFLRDDPERARMVAAYLDRLV